MHWIINVEIKKDDDESVANTAKKQERRFSFSFVHKYSDSSLCVIQFFLVCPLFCYVLMRRGVGSVHIEGLAVCALSKKESRSIRTWVSIQLKYTKKALLSCNIFASKITKAEPLVTQYSRIYFSVLFIKVVYVLCTYEQIYLSFS